MSLIEWCDYSFAPWFGCTRVSPACDICYAENWTVHRFHKAEWGPKAPRVRSAESTWKKLLTWNRKAAQTGRRARVFCSELSDVFDNQVPEAWRDDLWALIARCTNLDWLILTKRPQNIAKMLPDGWPWPHVWLGASAENQEEAERRIPVLLRIPAAIHFVSAEPLLEQIDLSRWLGSGQIDWVIVGGESDGRGRHRPFNPDWARFLLTQCRSAEAAFFMKQLGSNWPHHGTDPLLFPPDLRVREWPR